MNVSVESLVAIGADEANMAIRRLSPERRRYLEEHPDKLRREIQRAIQVASSPAVVRSIKALVDK